MFTSSRCSSCCFQLIVGAVQNGMLGVEMFETVERIFGHSASAPQENQQCKHHEKREALPCHSSSCLNTAVVDIGFYWALDLVIQDHSCNTIWPKARKKHDLSHGFGQFCHLFPMAMSLALLFKLILYPTNSEKSPWAMFNSCMRSFIL